MRRGTTLDLILYGQKGLVKNENIKGSLGCCDHATVGLKILGAARRAHTQAHNPGFQESRFGIFKDLPGRIP